MLSDERIEQLELENKVLQDNNKGLKTKIDEQSKEIEELKKPKYLLNAKTGEITTINNSEFISKDKIKDDYVYEELSKLKDKLVKEYEAAQEGFIKKQIPTSVVDGTIVQEVGWILNEIDKILKKAESISYKVTKM